MTTTATIICATCGAHIGTTTVDITGLNIKLPVVTHGYCGCGGKG